MPVTTSSAVRQLSDNNTQGTVLGQSTTDSISFYGATPIVQPSGAAQAALVRGTAGGSLGVNGTVQSPTLVANITTAEKSVNLAWGPSGVTGTGGTWLIASGDVLYVNKPASQAGLGVGNVRVSAAGIAGVTFSNFTAATITPTASQTYGFVAIRGLPVLSPVLSPAAVPPNTIAEQVFTVAGVRVGELLQVMKPTSQAGLDIAGCRVVGPNQIGINFANVTAATITPTASETYTVLGLGGLDTVSNVIQAQMDIGGSPSGVTTATVLAQAVTLTGLAVSDAIVGVSKPTIQNGLGLTNAFVSAANSVGLTFVNPTGGTLTPTANEVYNVAIFRPAPVAPLVLYNQLLTPAAVAANTTAEQTFTVTGLVSGSMVWVNKPTATPQLGIAGVRVSATNTLAINYANVSAVTITPPAETYTIGNFQQPIPDVGTSWVFSVNPTLQQDSINTNATRSALVNLGLIAGA